MTDWSSSAPGQGANAVYDYFGGSFKKPSSAFNLNRFMQAQRKTLAWAEIGGHSLVDPFNFFKKSDKAPPAIAPPPPPPDTAASMLREISRSQTDQQLLQSKRRSFMGGY